MERRRVYPVSALSQSDPLAGSFADHQSCVAPRRHGGCCRLTRHSDPPRVCERFGCRRLFGSAESSLATDVEPHFQGSDSSSGRSGR